MMNPAWTKELPFAITVCDKDGKVIQMNDKSISTFEKSGGAKLIGQSLFSCHPGESADKLAALLLSGRHTGADILADAVVGQNPGSADVRLGDKPDTGEARDHRREGVKKPGQAEMDDGPQQPTDVVARRVHLSDGEFARLLDEIVTADVYTAARTLRERNAFTRDAARCRSRSGSGCAA